MRLSAHQLAVEFAGRRAPVLDGVSLAVPEGRTLAIVGPSGAGKTTLLRAVAGLLKIRSGDVRLDGNSVAHLSPQRRRIALVMQHDALFPHMNVRSNLHFALRQRTRDDAARVATVAAAFHVGEFLDRKPRQLSGGERQRASIARALLSDPEALMLDEPLAHLDPALRRSVRDELVGLRETFAGPIVYVTHDHAEAMGVGDELAVLIDGRFEDCGEPQRVYDSPATIAVARFLGDRAMNVLDGDTYVAIRPEHVTVLDAAGAPDALTGTIVRRESTGSDAYLHVRTPRGEIVARVPAARPGAAGDAVALEFPERFVRRFDARTGTAVA